MGNNESTSTSKVDHHGDQQIKIINNQQTHSEILKDHAFMLYLILGLVIVTLGIQIGVILKNHFDKKAIKKARSMIALNDVTIGK